MTERSGSSAGSSSEPGGALGVGEAEPGEGAGRGASCAMTSVSSPAVVGSEPARGSLRGAGGSGRARTG